jgi:hypothetical protein
MKNSTSKQVSQLAESIFIRLNFGGDFTLLTNFNGSNFTDLDEAIDFVRVLTLGLAKHIELSHFDQAMPANDEWDNVWDNV